MLSLLHIENLAVIENAEVEFTAGLNVFSGETGAGKSVLIGGINAVRGGRVPKDMVRSGCDKAVITAVFTEIPHAAAALLSENGLDIGEDEDLIITREISASGGSVCRIGGRPVTQTLLRDIAADLVDIHGQNDTALLRDSGKQLELLDLFAESRVPEFARFLSEFKTAFAAFAETSKKLRTAEKAGADRERRMSELAGLLLEFSEYDLDGVDYEELYDHSIDLHIDAAVAETYRNLIAAIEGTDDAEGFIAQIAEAAKPIALEEDELSQELFGKLMCVIADIDDISKALANGIKIDDADLEQLPLLDAKLDFIRFMTNKYKCELPELLQKKSQWEKELTFLREYETETGFLLKEKKKRGEELKHKTAALSKARHDASELLGKQLSEELEFLAMPSARLIFSVSPDKVTAHGGDRAEIMFTANAGEPPKPLSKTASGGELSRVMLAMKSVLSDSMPTGDRTTMIFDEIDTGISGEAARKVALKLRDVSRAKQCLCVTHLPQIAAAGDRHLLILKTESDGAVKTGIHTLDFEGRKAEISRIIAGENGTEHTLEGAAEMLNSFKP